MSRKPRLLYIILLALLIVAGIAGLVNNHLLTRWFIVRHEVTRFDRQLWLANPDATRDDNPRYAMVNDLIKNHLKPGTPRATVHALLGKPDNQSEHDRQHNQESYNLDRAAPIAFDPSILEIQYDRNGKIKRVEVIQT